jgi:hypothetical protein
MNPPMAFSVFLSHFWSIFSTGSRHPSPPVAGIRMRHPSFPYAFPAVKHPDLNLPLAPWGETFSF